MSQINDLFGGMVGDKDAITFVEHMGTRIVDNDDLALQAADNAKERFAPGNVDDVAKDTVLDGLDLYQDMASQFPGNPRIRQRFNTLMPDDPYDTLHERGNAAPDGYGDSDRRPGD